MDDNIFRKKKSAGLRIWHWMTGLTIISLLLTVFLRNSVLRVKNTAELIQGKLQTSGTTISAEVARSIAKDIRNPVWAWHYYIGFFLLFLALFRLVLFIRNYKNERNPLTMIKGKNSMGNEQKPQTRYYAYVRITYGLFYVMLSLAVITGVLLYYKESLGIEKGMSSILKEAHEINMWFVIGFVIIHFVGVIAAEQKKETKGIISGMVNGGE